MYAHASAADCTTGITGAGSRGSDVEESDWRERPGDGRGGSAVVAVSLWGPDCDDNGDALHRLYPLADVPVQWRGAHSGFDCGGETDGNAGAIVPDASFAI